MRRYPPAWIWNLAVSFDGYMRYPWVVFCDQYKGTFVLTQVPKNIPGQARYHEKVVSGFPRPNIDPRVWSFTFALSRPSIRQELLSLPRDSNASPTWHQLGVAWPRSSVSTLTTARRLIRLRIRAHCQYLLLIHTLSESLLPSSISPSSRPHLAHSSATFAACSPSSTGSSTTT